MLALLGRNSSKRSVVRRAGSSSSKTSSKTSSSSTSNKPLTRGTPLLVEAVTVSWHKSLLSHRAVEIYNLLTSLVSQRAVATLVRGGCRLPQKFSPSHASNPCSRGFTKALQQIEKNPSFASSGVCCHYPCHSAATTDQSPNALRPYCMSASSWKSRFAISPAADYRH
jgi:hypothetical protein